MKKILIASIAIMTFAFSADYTQAQRIFDMQKMAQAMQDIQSGFFYNNIDIVKAGAEDLSKTITNIRPIKKEVEVTDVYERWMNNNTAMTKRTKRRIKNSADTIIERFADGDARQALQLYSKISFQCMKCHISLRKW